MGKQAHQNKISGKNGLTVEHNSVIEDNLLPAAEELAKLNAIDSSIITWIKERTAIEQDARIEFNKERIKLAGKDLNCVHVYNFMALVFAFIVLISAMFFSYALITKGMGVEGTCFAGGTIIIAAIFFIKASKNKEVK